MADDGHTTAAASNRLVTAVLVRAHQKNADPLRAAVAALVAAAAHDKDALQNVVWSATPAAAGARREIYRLFEEAVQEALPGSMPHVTTFILSAALGFATINCSCALSGGPFDDDALDALCELLTDRMLRGFTPSRDPCPAARR